MFSDPCNERNQRKRTWNARCCVGTVAPSGANLLPTKQACRSGNAARKVLRSEEDDVETELAGDDTACTRAGNAALRPTERLIKKQYIRRCLPNTLLRNFLHIGIIAMKPRTFCSYICCVVSRIRVVHAPCRATWMVAYDCCYVVYSPTYA